MGVKRVEEIYYACYLNGAIRQLNSVINRYNDIVVPIEKAAENSLKYSKLNGTGANAKHVLVGACISLATDKNCT